MVMPHPGDSKGSFYDSPYSLHTGCAYLTVPMLIWMDRSKAKQYDDVPLVIVPSGTALCPSTPFIYSSSLSGALSDRDTMVRENLMREFQRQPHFQDPERDRVSQALVTWAKGKVETVMNDAEPDLLAAAAAIRDVSKSEPEHPSVAPILAQLNEAFVAIGYPIPFPGRERPLHL